MSFLNENSSPSVKSRKMTPKEFLSQAWRIDSKIDKKIEERERLEAKLTAGRLSRLSGMPRGGSYDWTDGVARVSELTAQIDREIQHLCQVKRLVNEAIDAVEEMRYRRVLELRYRNYMSWEKIAEEMHYDPRWVQELHGRALLLVKVPDDFA